MNPLRDLNPLWITFGPVLAINVILAISLINFALRKDKPSVPQELASRNTSRYLGMFFKNWWYSIMTPACRFFIKLNITPNVLTTVGFVLGGLIAGVLFASRLYGIAGWAMIFGATFDIFDGYVARITKSESKSGAFYDSVMDRLAEGAVFIGIIYSFRNSWIAAFASLALVGSMLVSYTRARGEGVGVVCKKGSMQRPERIVYIGVASIFEPLVTALLKLWWENPAPISVIAAVIFVSVMTIGTSFYRMIYIMNELDRTEKRGKGETVPQLISKFYTKEGRTEVLQKAWYGYDRQRRKFDHVVLLLIGGMNIDFFRELLEKGELPNIQRHIIERGVNAQAITALPSTVGPTTAPFVTGCFPGTCNVPATSWFDKTIPTGKMVTIDRFRDYSGWGWYALDHDISKDIKTIFEYSRRAANVLGLINRGAGIIRDPFLVYAPLLRHKNQHNWLDCVDDVAFRMFKLHLKRSADFILYYLPTLDPRFREHCKFDTLLEEMGKIDACIGRIAGELKDNGVYDNTLLIFTADHGCSKAEKSLNLCKHLSKYYRLTNSRQKSWRSSDAMCMISGSGLAHIYLKKANNWSQTCYFEDLDSQPVLNSLLSREEVGFIAMRSRNGSVAVLSRIGKAFIKLVSDKHSIKYRLEGNDPFGYKGIRGSISYEEALSATINSQYPDGIVQIAQLFHSTRSGDMIVSSAPNCTFSDVNSDIVRGNLQTNTMTVPLCISTGIKKKLLRTTDIFVIIAEALGIEIRHCLDGNTDTQLV